MGRSARSLTSRRLLRSLLDIALDDERLATPRGPDPGRRGGRPARFRLDPPLSARRAARFRGGARRAAGAGRRRRRRRRPRPRPRARRLPGAAAGPLLPLARDRLRVPPGAAAAPGRPADRRAGRAHRRARRRERRAAGRRRQRGRPRRGGPRRLAAPGGLRPAQAARRSTSATSPSSWSRPATSAPSRSRTAASSRSAAASSTSSRRTEERAARLELFGDEIESIRWFSTFTQRSLGEAERIELDPAAELALEHRELAEIASEEDGERPDVAELLPVDSFRAPLDLIGERHRGRDRRGRGDPGGARATTGRT